MQKIPMIPTKLFLFIQHYSDYANTTKIGSELVTKYSKTKTNGLCLSEIEAIGLQYTGDYMEKMMVIMMILASVEVAYFRDQRLVGVKNLKQRFR